MKRHFPRIASLSALAVGVMLAAPAARRHRTTAFLPPSSNGPPSPRPKPRDAAAAAGRTARGRSMTLAETSWTYQAPADTKNRPAQRHREGHGLGQVANDEPGQDRSQEAGLRRSEVDELDQVLRREPGRNGTTAATTARRKSAATSTTNSRRRATCRPQDKLSFVISCRIVDKRPNGNCVLEGTWSVQRQRRELGILALRRGPSGRHQAGQLDRQRHDRRSEDHQAGSGPRPRQLSPRLGLGMARQVAAVLGSQ